MTTYLDRQNFEEQEKIGTRNYCNLYTILNKQTGVIYLAEKLKFMITDSSKSDLRAFLQEINSISKISHPSILKYIGYIPEDTNKKPIILTEYGRNGSLRSILTQSSPIIDGTKKLIIAYGIANSLLFLHSNDVLHSNIQLDNIFLDENFYPKLSNFGISKLLSIKTEKVNDNSDEVWLSAPRYIAPEIWNHQKYTKSSEIYSFSILLYELMTNEIAFSEVYDIFELRDKITKGVKPSKLGQIDDGYRQIIERGLSTENSKRPTISEIVKILREDKRLITDDVYEEEYLLYIEKIDRSVVNFDPTIEILKDDFVENGKTTNYEFNPSDYLNSSIELSHLLNLEDFEKKEKLGQATDSESFKLIEKKSGLEYVGKTSLNEFITDDYKSIIKLSYDVNKLTKIDHHSFVKFIGYSPIDFVNDYRPVIVTRYVQNYTLESMIQMEGEKKAPKSWNMTKKIIVIYGIASAMSYLHSKEIIHQTLTTCNILLDQYLIPKIAGIGSFINSRMSFFDLFNQEQHKFAYFAPRIHDELSTNESSRCLFICYNCLRNSVCKKSFRR